MRRHVLGLTLLFACGDDTGTQHDAAWIPPEEAAVATTLAVTNFVAEDELGYSLALLRGDALGPTVAIESGGERIEWPVVNGHFKALVPLQAGRNAIALVSGNEGISFPLRFTEQTNDHYVRPLWIEASDGAGTFEAPPGIANDEAAGIARVQIAAWMWQTFYAEVMYARGKGRKTFKLPLDATGRPVVAAVRSTKTLAQLRAMTDVEVWGQLYGDFGGFGGAEREKIKDVGVLSFSHYVPGTMTIQAGGALGGGHQATMHGANVFTWPASLAQVAPAFLATTAIDPSMFPDDSVGRTNYWGAYTTTSGAVLHELGHTLGFPHNITYQSIMFRGFDNWNRFFMASEASAANGPGIAELADTDLPVSLVDYEATWLAYDRWFAQAIPPASNGGVTTSQTGDTITITSPNGIRDVVFTDRSQSLGAEEFITGAPPPTKTYSATALKAQYPGSPQLGILVKDDKGESGNLDVN